VSRVRTTTADSTTAGVATSRIGRRDVPTTGDVAAVRVVESMMLLLRFRSADGRRTRGSSMAAIVADSESRQRRSGIHRRWLRLPLISRPLRRVTRDTTLLSRIPLLLLLLLLLSKVEGATGNTTRHASTRHACSSAAHRCSSARVAVLTRRDGVDDCLCVWTVVWFDLGGRWECWCGIEEEGEVRSFR
jgi:hypothetical protein